ncbi:MAG: surface lipoprotein assembly modifier [Alphaproteobacteria bacterium]
MRLITICLLLLSLQASAFSLSIKDYTTAEQYQIIRSLNREERYRDSLNILAEIPILSYELLELKKDAENGLQHQLQTSKSFRETLEQAPSRADIRLKLAQTLENTGYYDAARYQYNRLLNDEVSDELRQNAIASVNRLEESSKNWYIHLKMSGYYDANINRAPKQKRVEIQGYWFNLESPISAYMLATDLKMGVNYRIKKGLSWQTHGAALLQNALWASEDTHNRYDMLNIQLQTGLVYRPNMKHRYTLQTYIQRGYQGYHFEHQYIGLQGSYSLYYKQLMLGLSQDFSYRDYVANAFDGWQSRSNINLAWASSPKEQYSLGLEYIYNKAQQNVHTYQSLQANLVWSKLHAHQINTTLSLWCGLRSYEARSQLFLSRRKDYEWGTSIDFAKNNWKIYSLVPHFQYGYKQLRSNQTIFNQNAHQFMFYFVKNF